MNKRCFICGRRLTNHESMIRGYGLSCGKKIASGLSIGTRYSERWEKKLKISIAVEKGQAVSIGGNTWIFDGEFWVDEHGEITHSQFVSWLKKYNYIVSSDDVDDELYEKMIEGGYDLVINHIIEDVKEK